MLVRFVDPHKLSNIDKKTRYNIDEILDLTSKPHDVPSVDFFGPF